MACVKCHSSLVIPAQAGIYGFEFCIHVTFYYTTAAQIQIPAYAGITLKKTCQKI